MFNIIPKIKTERKKGGAGMGRCLPYGRVLFKMVKIFKLFQKLNPEQNSN